MVATWSDSDVSSSDEELEINITANLCFMAKEDEVCDDDLDDDIQHEYDCLFNDYEKLMEKGKAYRKTIASLNLELEHAKKDSEIIIDDKKNLQINLDNEKSNNEVLKLELDNKNEDLIKCMNENSALKLSLRENPMHGSHEHFKNKNKHHRKKNANITCYKCGRI